MHSVFFYGYNSEHMITTIFFDLGNTLLYNDHRTGILAACRALASVIASYGYPVSTSQLAQTHYENLTEYYKTREINCKEVEAQRFLRRTLAPFGLEDLPEEQITAATHAFYAQTEMNWHLTESAIPMLQQLRESGKKIGLITNASSAYDVHQLLRLNGLDNLLDTVTTSAETGFRKPHQNIYLHALRSSQSTPQESLMVGDTFIADIYGSARLDMKAIWFNRYTEDWATQALFPAYHANAETQDLLDIPRLITRL